MGVSIERFDDSTPVELEPYIKAYEIRKQQEDTSMYQMGMYVLSAVQTAVQNALHGRKSKAKYLDKPLLQTMAESKKIDDENLSEEEKKKQRKLLLAKLQLMQANFELNHSEDGKVS